MQDQSGVILTNSLDVRINTNLSYLNVPIMIKYYLSDKINVELGPQFGYMLSGKFNNKIKDSGGLSDDFIESVGGEGKFDIQNRNEFDLGLNIGMGYDFYENFTLGLRYNYGFTEVFDGSPLKNSAIQLSLEYQFN